MSVPSFPLDHTVGSVSLTMENNTWVNKDIIEWEGGFWLDFWRGGLEPDEDDPHYEDRMRNGEGFVASVQEQDEGANNPVLTFNLPYDLATLEQGWYIGILRNGCDRSCCKIFFLVGQNICFTKFDYEAVCSDDVLKSPNCVKTEVLTACCGIGVEVLSKYVEDDEGNQMFILTERPTCRCREPVCGQCVSSFGEILYQDEEE